MDVKMTNYLISTILKYVSFILKIFVVEQNWDPKFLKKKENEVDGEQEGNS